MMKELKKKKTVARSPESGENSLRLTGKLDQVQIIGGSLRSLDFIFCVMDLSI